MTSHYNKAFDMRYSASVMSRLAQVLKSKHQESITTEELAEMAKVLIRRAGS